VDLISGYGSSGFFSSSYFFSSGLAYLTSELVLLFQAPELSLSNFPVFPILLIISERS